MNSFINITSGFKFNLLEQRILQAFAFNKSSCFLHELMFLGFEFSLLYPESLNLELTKGKFFLKLITQYPLNKINNYTDIPVNYYINTNNNYSKFLLLTKKIGTQINYISNSLNLIINTGARSNNIQSEQLSGIRGFVSNIRNYNIYHPILNNFTKGLNLIEYIKSSYGTRQGLLDTALNTSETGFLTRRLVESIQDIVLKEITCNSYMKTIAKTEVDIIGNLEFNYNIIKNKYYVKSIRYNNLYTIYFKTPFNCISGRSICYTCLGYNYQKEVLPNLNIGVLAATSIGEPSTQLILRTFHTGGVFNLKSKSIRVNKVFISSRFNKGKFLVGRTFYKRLYSIKISLNKLKKIIPFNLKQIKFKTYFLHKKTIPLLIFKNNIIFKYQVNPIIKNTYTLNYNIYYNKYFINTIQDIYMLSKNLLYNWCLCHLNITSRIDLLIPLISIKEGISYTKNLKILLYNTLLC